MSVRALVVAIEAERGDAVIRVREEQERPVVQLVVLGQPLACPDQRAWTDARCLRRDQHQLEVRNVVSGGCIPPAQAVPIDEDDPWQNPPVIGPWLAVSRGKIRRQPLHLLVRQPIQVLLLNLLAEPESLIRN